MIGEFPLSECSIIFYINYFSASENNNLVANKNATIDFYVNVIFLNELIV